jgi:hypothetical protein
LQDAEGEAQKTAGNTEPKRKTADQKMKEVFERKYQEFIRSLQKKLPEERMKKSVYCLA